MIIVEGCDNTGKTTLVNTLANDPLLNKHGAFKTEKSSGPTASLGEHLNWVTKAIRTKNPRVIYDRYAPICERVYGPLLRPAQGDKFGPYTFDLLRITTKLEPVIIYCRPSQDVVEEWGAREQMGGVKSHVTEILARYDWVMELIQEMACGKTLFMRYDYTKKNSYDEVRAACEMYLKSHELHNGRYE